MEPQPVLWQFRFSHFNEKARWALDYKGIPHHRRSVLPGPHVPIMRRVSGDSKVPVLQLGSEIVPDSTRILETLERRWPDPALVPEDPALRRKAWELEEFFDEQVGWYFHAMIFHLNLDQTATISAMLTTGFPAWTTWMFRAFTPLLRSMYVRKYHIDERAEIGDAKLRAGLDRIAREVGPSGYLVGDRFSVADLTGAALLYGLVFPPEFPYRLPDMPDAWKDYQASLAPHPGLDWIREMYRRHRGKSCATNE